MTTGSPVSFAWLEMTPGTIADFILFRGSAVGAHLITIVMSIGPAARHRPHPARKDAIWRAVLSRGGERIHIFVPVLSAATGSEGRGLDRATADPTQSWRRASRFVMCGFPAFVPNLALPCRCFAKGLLHSWRGPPSTDPFA